MAKPSLTSPATASTPVSPPSRSRSSATPAPTKTPPTGPPTPSRPTRHETTGRPLPGSALPIIRPTLLRWLLTTSDATALLEPRGLRVWNARLIEPLDLIGCTLSARLELRYCLVEAPILLDNASLPTLSLRNSTLERTLDAPFLKLHGPLTLDDITADTLNFNGATISAEVRFSNTTLTSIETALSLAGAYIASDLILWPGLRSSGSLNIARINVGGLVSAANANIDAKNGAINANEAVIHGNFLIDKGFCAASEVRMRGAIIGGQLNCNQSKFVGKELNLLIDGAKISQGAYLREIESSGLIRMLGAEIKGDLNFVGVKLMAPKRTLWLENTRVRDHVMFNNSFYSKGTVQMMGAHIGGQVMCQDAFIALLNGAALTVVRDLFG